MINLPEDTFLHTCKYCKKSNEILNNEILKDKKCFHCGEFLFRNKKKVAIKKIE